MLEGYHIVKLDRSYWHQLPAMTEWCFANFGEGGHHSLGDVWRLETAFGNMVFGFKREQDAAHFSLRWV